MSAAGAGKLSNPESPGAAPGSTLTLVLREYAVNTLHVLAQYAVRGGPQSWYVLYRE